MSHFATLVITSFNPANNLGAFKEIMQPYHEYECTGVKDKYVIFVDKHEEYLESYGKDKKLRVKMVDGSTIDYYDERFYREPTALEKVAIGEWGGSGSVAKSDKFPDGFSYYSTDWKDGTGYRAKIHMAPEEIGLQVIDIPVSEIYSNFDDWVQYYDGSAVKENGKWGRYTNPNSKWDWYVIGGRYSGRLFAKAPDSIVEGECSLTNEKEKIEGINSCRKGNLDLKKMKKEKVAERLCEKLEIVMKAMEVYKGEDVEEKLSEAFIEFGLLDKTWKSFSEDHKPKYWDWIKEQSALVGLFHKVISRYDYIKLIPGQSLDDWAFSAPALSSWVVIKDGKWYQKGEMGWWGSSSNHVDNWEEQLDKLIKETPDDHYLTFVDCHI